jgi:FixJ family two-component response regulator
LVTGRVIRPDLILADYNLPNGLNGLQLAAKVREKLDCTIPVIILTGDISTSTLRDIALQGCVQVNKPVRMAELTQVIQRLLTQPLSTAYSRAPPVVEATSGSRPPTIFIVDDDRQISAWRANAAKRTASLTPRQRQIMELVLAGHPSKNIAADLGVSQRTVENHRAAMMRKTGTRSLPELARLALAASQSAD